MTYPTALAFAADARAAAGLDDARAPLPGLNEQLRDEAVASAPQPLAEAVAALDAARNPHHKRDAMQAVVSVAARVAGVLAPARRSRVGSGGERDAHGSDARLRLLADRPAAQVGVVPPHQALHKVRYNRTLCTMWIPRTIEGALARLGRQRPVVVLTGARQTGKTSLVRRVFPDHSYVSLDLPSEAEQAERDPRGFLARHRPPLVIDEVQYAPGVFRHIKAVVDADRRAGGRFILTGSQKLTLMEGVSESLAGRAAVLELEGLTWAEIHVVAPDLLPEQVAVRGSLPELYERPDLDPAEFYRSYVATYLERDLRSLLNVTSLRDYERFVRACAFRSAQLLNKAELARDVGIAPSTAAQWLTLLEASNQVYLLEPWFSNRTRSLVKTPKVYLCDPGLQCHLLGIQDADDLLGSPLAGAVWETLVCSELRRQLRYGRPGELFFWRDRSREVDFVIHRAGRFELFEAKWTEHPDRGDAAQLARVAAELPAPSVRSMSVVCRTGNAFPLPGGARAMPLTEL